MSATIMAWVLSLAGAGLFFAAGTLFALRRNASRATRDVVVGAERDTISLRAAVDVTHHELGGARRDLAEAQRDRDHFRNSLAAALVERDHQHGLASALAAERDHLAAERGAVASMTTERGRDQALIATLGGERDRERAAVIALTAERDRERHNAAALTAERDRLRAERIVLDKTARENAARAEQARRDAAALVAELREKRRSAPARPVFVSDADAGARGDALRTILDEETRGNGFAGAVITDELGLVVAATGEYGDALAAYGAFLVEVGAKTRDALPLHELRQVIVQDEHDMILTVRPIASADDNLALVTLAAGRNGTTPRAGTSPER